MTVASQGRTTILIAHRLQTARLAQRILVVDDGRVIEDGSHDTLLAMGGEYTALWNASNGVRSATSQAHTTVGLPPAAQNLVVPQS